MKYLLFLFIPLTAFSLEPEVRIKFDGTNVQVAGQITISAGSTSEVDFGAGAAASASAASASAESTAL